MVTMAAVLLLSFLLPILLATESRPMDGLSCRSITPKQILCTGKNEDYIIGIFNVRLIATAKYKRRRKLTIKECNSTYVAKTDVYFPTLMHDDYDRLRCIFQDAENNMTQEVKVVTCRPTCANDTIPTTVTYTKYELVSWDPHHNYFDPEIVTFNLPTCCECAVEEL